MKIVPASINLFPNYKNSLNIKPQAVSNNKISELTNLHYPVSFYGGNSMSLEKTRTALDKIQDAYPPDIQTDIQDTIVSGNPENHTLIDIHKKKYEYLNLCETLDEAKSIYPEFKDVLSDSQVIYKEGSFIDEVKCGQVRGFDPDIDVALQLLQLYWGEGFSLTTLKEDYADKNVHYTFRKLGIPRVNSVYGQYLKLSDKDYNERYTRTISERAKEIERKRIEKAEGIYVPRGPMSEEQKLKISEGLRKYYSENPEKIQEMSARQIRFYEENPDEKEKLSQVGIRAWSYKEADSVKKKLAKILHKQSLSEEDIAEISNPNSKHKEAFKGFWQKNGWAKNIISSCMKKSWQRQDELSVLGLIYEPLYEIEVLPRPLMKLANADFPEYHDINFKYVIMNPKDEKRNTQKYVYSKDDFIKVMSQQNSTNRIIYTMVPLAVIAKTYSENNNSFNKEVEKISDLYNKSLEKYINKPNQDEHNGYCFEIVMDMLDACIKNKDTKTINLIEKTIQEISEKVYAYFVNGTMTQKQWDNYCNPLIEKSGKVANFKKKYNDANTAFKKILLENLLAQVEQDMKKKS